MEPAVVVRGRITNARTKEVMRFNLNPSSIKHQPGTAKHVSDPIPGMSHPKRSYAAGDNESWSFTLDIDGDMLLREYIDIPQNARRPAGPKSPFSVRGYTEFIIGLCRPTDKTKGASGAPDFVVFSFGGLVKAVKCDMEVGAIDYAEFDPKLEPTIARVPLVLTRVVEGSELQAGVWGGWA